MQIKLNLTKIVYVLETRQTRKRRGTTLRTYLEIAAALDVDSETEELLSRA
jgi:hypothetical protein